MSDQQTIHKKGFDMIDNHYKDYQDIDDEINFGKVKVGAKILDDAVLHLGAYQRINRKFGNKMVILKALSERNLPLLREISNYFFRTSGIYSKLCDYVAHLYRYDWYIVPELLDDKTKEEKVLTEFDKILTYLDNSHIQKVCGDIALEVVKSGAYYGYISDENDQLTLQQLPANYCRSRYLCGTMPTVEFNMNYFDETFKDLNYRMKILNMFPNDFKKGYMLFKQGKLPADNVPQAPGGWYLLDPEYSVKFNIHNDDVPLFVNAIPAIIDLDAAQDLDRRKQMQQLLKIVVQQLPRDKNGDLIFDIDEARDLHNNAVEMLQRAVGVDVLTTFADIKVEDLADRSTSTKTDDLERVERTVYNAAGVSRNIFNTDGNLSLEKSVLNDESVLRDLLLQFKYFYNKVVSKRNVNRKKFVFKFHMLETTQYNYKDLSKMYKEQVQMGYSKMLPQIALGHSQSEIIHTAHFENEILHLSSIMIPPLISTTLNSDAILGMGDQSDGSKTQKSTDNKSSGSGSVKVLETEEKTAGRPEKSDDQKSEKTIQNRESMG